jgi:MFS-type transporter involved in bile tolerance (Atg22 family)
LFGWMTAVTHSQRAGISVVILLLIIGLGLLLRVREPGRAG